MSTEDRHYVGEIGTDIILTALDEKSGINDISTATIHAMKVLKPYGVEDTWNTTLDSTTGLIHTVKIGDLDQAGKYKIQNYLEIGDWKGLGSVFQLIVLPKFGK